MRDVVQLLKDSGAFGYVALAVGMAGVAFAVVVALVIGFLRWRVPASLGWLGLTLALGVAAVAGPYGEGLTQSAFEHGVSGQRMSLMAAGIVMAMGPLLFAGSLAAGGFLLAAWGTAITAAVMPGPAPKVEWKAAGTSVGVGVVAFVGVFAVLLGTQGVGVLLHHAVVLSVAVLGAGATVVASARVASEDRLQQGRIAGSRGAVLVAASLAVVAGGAAGWVLDVMYAFMAVAQAPADVKMSLLEGGIAAAGSGLSAAFLLALIPLASGFSGLSSIFGRANGRVAIGAVVGGVQVLGVLAALYVVHGSTLTALRLAAGQISVGAP